jgi:hypothetical protein
VNRDPLDGSCKHLAPRPTEERRGDVQKIRRARPDRLEWAQTQGLDARLHLLICTKRTRTSTHAYGVAEAG